MIDTRAIAAALGGQVAAGNTILCPGPGHSPRDRSLAVRLDPRAPDGFLCFSHCGDDWRDCRDHVRQKLGLPEWQPGDGRQRVVPQQHVARWDLAAIEDELKDIPPPFTEDELARIANAQRLWDEAADPRGTLAEKYLREVRCLTLPDELAGTVLRFHAECPWRNENSGRTEYVPALIAAFRSINGDEITAIHRIALNADAAKIGRRMLGIVARAAIKLDAPDGDKLTIGEGIETALAAREIMTMGALPRMPVWALGSVGAISFFPILDGIKQLVILGEADEASKRAVEICKMRWHGKARRRVRVVMPINGSSDLNDVLIAKKARG
jgi:putative DNA primase/helicase